MEFFKSDNVQLRPIILQDLELLNKWKNDENIYKYLGGGFLPTSVDVQKSWMNNLMDTSGNNKRFIIEMNGQGIGMIGIYGINWIHRTCELGLFIGEENYHGKGYASESCLLIESYAKQYLNLRKIKLYVVEENKSALYLYKKMNYKIVGKLEDERFISGKYCSVYMMEKFI